MTIKIGDRVRMTDSYDGRQAETDGTVMKHTFGTNYNVKFDAPFLGHGEDDRCWNVPASKLALVGEPAFKVEVGKTYVMRAGGLRGPIEAQDDFLTAGGMHYAANGECCYRGKSGDTVRPGEDLIAEWVEPVAEPARYKVGDKVRMSNGATYFAGQDTTIARVDEHDDVMPYLVTTGDDRMWVYPKDIAGPAAPAVAKVGDWVRAGDGRVGILFGNDGGGWTPLHVGYPNGDASSFDPGDLTVVPAGTVAAANDNAPILAEIETLQARIDGLRASLA
jgi:hypothetical protein